MLTNTAIARVKPKEKNYLLPDADGLSLVIYPSGRRSWMVRYWQRKKEVRKIIGEYPAMTLADARQARDALKLAVRTGAIGSRGVTFEAVANEWYKVRQVPNFTRGHLTTVRQKLDSYVLPIVGHRPIGEIKRLELTDLLARMVAKGVVESAHRTAGIVRMVFEYAVDKGILSPDGALVAGGLVRVLPSRPHEHFASIKRESDVGHLMRALGSIDSFVVRTALQIVAYTFVRSGELRQATWAEIDFDTATWTIPAGHTKRNRLHIVPLSSQVIDLLQRLKYATHNDRKGAASFVFPSGHANSATGNLSEASMIRSLNRLHDRLKDNPALAFPKMTVHGFRSMASTLLNEQRWHKDAIEAQLAHKDPNAIRQVYNAAEYLELRREMMQHWADYLDALRGEMPALEKP